MAERESDGQARVLVERLYDELASTDRPIYEICKAAGVNLNYPKRCLNKGNMDLGRFCRLVQVSGKSLTRFVAEALDELPAVLQGAALLPRRPAGEEPDLVQRARKRAVSSDAVATIPKEHLERLDDVRYDDPAKAQDGIEAVIDFVTPADVPFALGVYASCCRALLQMTDASFALHAGFELSHEFEQLANRANLWQRASVIQLVQCEYEKALACSERAMVSYFRLGDRAGAGQALVDQGTILWEVNRFAESEAALRSGLELLPSSYRRHRCAAHQTLAVLLEVKGCYLDALESLSGAVPLAGSSVEVGKLMWLQGRCLGSLDRIDEALGLFHEALDLLSGPLPADAALLVCDQVRLLVERGRHREGLEQARAIRRLIIPLEEQSPRLAAAARDLAAIEIDSSRQALLELIHRIQERVNEARRREPASLHPSC